MSPDSFVLVGDVGGTHVRFAVVGTAPFYIADRLDLPADAYPTFDAALDAYLDHLGTEHPSAAAIGVAGPVTAGRVTFTNRNWEASEEGLHQRGFARALLINDFAAAAYAVAALEPDDQRDIGPRIAGVEGEPITVLGAGTGFGVSCLARFRGNALPVATEGGHVSFAPQTEEQNEVRRILAARFGHVSAERILSGPGLVNLHAALGEMTGQAVPACTAADIVQGAEASNVICAEAVEMFCAIFGATAGDFALAHGARGGVYIAGGIARKIEPLLIKSAFRAQFENKGRLSYYVRAIPTRLILNEDSAFLGAALALEKFGNVRN